MTVRVTVSMTIGVSIGRVFLGVVVALEVEGHEEHEEGDQDEFLEPEDQSLISPGEITETANVGHRDDRKEAINELDELSLGEILLPGRGSSHGGHQVAPVHKSVDESISDDTVVQEEHSSLEISEGEGGNDGMVLEMEERVGSVCNFGDG